MKDLDIRVVLNKFLHDKFVLHDPTCVLLDEFGLCQGTARIDMAVINGHIHGYEIKSEEDTLYRLSQQMEVYSKTLDYLTLVTNAKHLSELREVLPKWCGIMVVDAAGRIQEKRAAKKNKGIDPSSLVQLLWRDETIDILRRLGHNKGLSKPNYVLWERLASSLELDELNARVRETLKVRKATTSWRFAQPQVLRDGSLLRSAR